MYDTNFLSIVERNKEIVRPHWGWYECAAGPDNIVQWNDDISNSHPEGKVITCGKEGSHVLQGCNIQVTCFGGSWWSGKPDEMDYRWRKSPNDEWSDWRLLLSSATLDIDNIDGRPAMLPNMPAYSQVQVRCLKGIVGNVDRLQYVATEQGLGKLLYRSTITPSWIPKKSGGDCTLDFTTLNNGLNLQNQSDIHSRGWLDLTQMYTVLEGYDKMYVTLVDNYACFNHQKWSTKQVSTFGGTTMLTLDKVVGNVDCCPGETQGDNVCNSHYAFVKIGSSGDDMSTCTSDADVPGQGKDPVWYDSSSKEVYYYHCVDGHVKYTKDDVQCILDSQCAKDQVCSNFKCKDYDLHNMINDTNGSHLGYNSGGIKDTVFDIGNWFADIFGLHLSTSQKVLLGIAIIGIAIFAIMKLLTPPKFGGSPYGIPMMRPASKPRYGGY